MKAGLGFGGIVVALAAAGVLGVRAAWSAAGEGPFDVRARLRPCAWWLLAATGTSFLSLVLVLAGDDFSVRHVAEHSSRVTPLPWKVAAAWAAPAGRLLLGAAFLAIGIGLFLRTVGEDDRAGAAAVGLLAGANAASLALLASVANPFLPQTPIPADGSGTRSATTLLGALHPLLLTAGCVALAIPLALVLGARLAGDRRQSWRERAHRWAGPAWVLITLGLLCQAWWSASTLGWRGPLGWRSPSPGLLVWPAATTILVATHDVARRGRRWSAGRMAAMAGVALVCGPALLLASRPMGPGRAGAALAAGRDLATVSISEMEDVIAGNPTVVGMRLALSERYLGAGRTEEAHRQASIALALDPPTAQRQEALKLLGWSAALLGRAQEGAALLEQSLAIDAADRDATWFLANVRLVGLNDAAGAAALIEQLLSGAVTDDQRRTLEARLLDARVGVAAVGSPPVSPAPTARP